VTGLFQAGGDLAAAQPFVGEATAKSNGLLL
jgi:hypothetical protein